MVRLTRSLAVSACGVGLLLVSTGCRSTRPEVPPGRPYSSDGRQRPAIGFSTDAHPVDGSAMTNIMPDSAGANKMADGIGSAAARPEVSTALGGAQGTFGPPGTSGRPGNGTDTTKSSPASDESLLPAGAPDLGRPSISPISSASATGSAATAAPGSSLPPDSQPDTDPAPAPSQLIPPQTGAGQMGSATDLPSPN